MRTLFVVLFSALMLVPAAAAGPSAGTEVLESSESCGSGGWSDTGSYSTPTSSWSWSYWQQTDTCSDSLTYASATVRDDAGDIAVASASASNESASQSDGSQWYSTWNDGSASGYGSGSWHKQSSAESWSRDARADAAGASLAATRGCSSSTSSSSWYSNSGYASSTTWGSQQSWNQYYGDDSSASDDCATGATLAHAGRSESAAFGRQCEYNTGSGNSKHEQTYYSSGNSSATYRRESRSNSTSHECREGVTTGGATGPAFVGTEGTCSARGEEWTHSSPWSNETYTTSTQEESCTRGLLVEGPSGMELRFGSQTSSWEECDQGNCSEGGTDFFGFDPKWDYNPLGPDAIPAVGSGSLP